MKAEIQNLRDLIGRGLVNKRDRKVYQVTAVGMAGLTAYEVNEDGKRFGPPNDITWRAVKALYSIIVRVEEIDDG